MSFATPLSDLGASVMRNFANATARFNGGAPVSCIYREPAQIASLGIAGAFARRPQIDCLRADVPEDLVDLSVVVDHPALTSVPYFTVAQREPDERNVGMVRLLLEPAP